MIVQLEMKKKKTKKREGNKDEEFGRLRRKRRVPAF